MTKSFSDRVSEAKANHGTITPAELKEKLDSDTEVTVVDVRDANALGGGVIPGAKNVSLGTLFYKADPQSAFHDKETFQSTDQPIVCTCGGGGQAAVAASVLAEYGYTNVTIVEGGTKGWSAEGLPTEDQE